MPYLVKGVELLQLASGVHQMYLKQNNHERKRLVDTCLSNLIWKDGTIEYNWKKPFDLMVKYSETKKWGEYLDAFGTACLEYGS